ncbi:MAG: exodeoxyribonuclease V subunit gamma, partial [Balneolaceae bacterium]
QQDRAPQKTGTIKGDSSIQVHACHSPRREVEVLYNQLLAVLDENSSIMPDDILIVTPDIETYIPMIEAVFGTADEGQPELPYSIADRGIMGTKPAIQTFLKILSLCQSRFKVTDVLDLLDTSPIQDAFDINDDRLNRLERWIRDNRIRWGIDGDFKKELNMPPSKSYTWISGLDRMVLGYAMKTEDDCLYEDIFPYNEIENSDDALLVGTFTRMMNELFALNKAIQDLKTVREWVKILSNVTENFIPDSRHYFRELSTISNTLEQLKEYAKISGCDDKVPFNIVAAWLEEQLEKHSTGGGRIGRGITFSSFVPMRNIPFKVLGMIGMNDGSFPQVKLPIEFDLMHLEPQAGDPNGSQDDRYLFLESLISTNSHLYFSFVGQSDRQDKDFPPSVILREFIDYLEEYYGVKSEELVTRHRLQAFSPEYFKGEKYFSYSETQKNISRQLSRGGPNPKNFMIEELPDPDEEWKTVLVRDFVSFFQHPAKFLFQKRLGIYMGQDNVITEDREPFELDSLDSYKVGQELLNRYLKNKPLDSYRQILKKRDMIPEGWVGEQAYRVKAQEVREFGRAISQQLDQQPLEDREIDFDINGFRIVGKLANIFETARIKYRFGSMRPKDMIETWIEHLIFQLVRPGQGGYSRYFIWNKDKSQLGEQCLSPLDNVEPVLERLLGLYWKGLKKNTYFFPETSFEFAHEVCYRHKDPEYGFKKASAKWIRDYGYSGECEDPYNKLLLGAENPLDSNLFKETAIDFWGPFFDVLNQGEEVG